ncbi:MAG TPA: cobalamin-dependent protein [Acidimicrobiales bacterium]|nr:cobalamin-dependent protein [Acidimicrobiales bacterium]
MDPTTLTIQEAATRLGLHYMTVYRYVRIGRLPAEYRDGRWHIAAHDLESVKKRPAGRPAMPTATNGAAKRRRPAAGVAATRMYDRLLAGDGPGAWLLVENALLAGGPSDVYVQILGPALKAIGDSWEAGRITVADEHRATVLALGIIGRLGPLFTRRGRHRPGCVLLAGAQGDPHAIPLIMVGDLLRANGFQVVQLGADVPLETLLASVVANRPAVVGISASTAQAAKQAAEAVAALHDLVGDMPVIVGGPAVTSQAQATELGADGWAADATRAVELIVEMSGGAA